MSTPEPAVEFACEQCGEDTGSDAMPYCKFECSQKAAYNRSIALLFPKQPESQ